ncbi:uncharacterized protein ACA1_354310 [Acanthamoeba castellanii str. Neff]|uniref:Uncharacterized protein n=1 Tax=Acanthamoeba castellanii (strain ATCC 30010 / Neff) TaxID=1257118 RepID=L8GE48_ACACF|nr:uncharacterized protein ACA1_354310 [Acanthamoeba castellanii str. Neff]ELR10993.1 hypothetical protein ACA1_354310 [Acanthamoeba castellanii str. Neff]
MVSFGSTIARLAYVGLNGGPVEHGQHGFALARMGQDQGAVEAGGEDMVGERADSPQGQLLLGRRPCPMFMEVFNRQMAVTKASEANVTTSSL